MTKTIVLIDDDQDDLDLLIFALRDVDPSLVCVGFVYPEEALRVLLAKEVLPDYIFIDINMPGISGDKCLKTLRSHPEFDGIKIILCSTSMPESIAESLRQAGANHTFEKPVRLRTYSEILKTIIA